MPRRDASSGPTVNLTYIFGWEPLRSVLDAPNLRELILDQAEELSVFRDHFAPDPDWQGLAALEAAGHFKVFTVRDDGWLVGYVPFYLVHHPHYRTTRWATADNYYVDPAHRGRVGIEMFRRALAAIWELDPPVRVVIMHDKVHTDRERVSMGDLFGKLGGQMIERLYMWMRK